MFYLFEQMEEGIYFAHVATTQIPVGKVMSITYLIILEDGEVKKSCKKWEEIPAGQEKIRHSRTIFHYCTGY